MQALWPGCGFDTLERTDNGWLQATPAFLRLFLAAPELALVAESCAAERSLHSALLDCPSRHVNATELGDVIDADARANYVTYLGFRDALLCAGTVEAYYLSLMRSAAVTIPPGFVDRLVQVIVRNALGACTDPFEARAAELLFRTQRISRSEGRVLCADRLVVDMLNETAGFGELGRLLVQGNAPVRAVEMTVLTPDNASRYWHDSDRHHTLLDLTHELTTDIGHGLQFTMARTHSGLAALARVLRAWLAHLLGVRTVITPLRRIDDSAWRWHVGLDAVSMALLNDLYEDRSVEPARLEDMVSLFRLDFEDPGDVLAEMAGKPVYLGLATTPDGTLKVKPQNLLLNLPLSHAM